MSRAASNTVAIPDGARVDIAGNTVSVEGSNGKISYHLHPLVQLVAKEKEIKIAVASNSNKTVKMLTGTTRALLQNMVTGVSVGFERRLEIVGVGYRAQAQGRSLSLSLGFSHPVNLEIPEGISIETPSSTEIVIKGNGQAKSRATRSKYS